MLQHSFLFHIYQQLLTSGSVALLPGRPSSWTGQATCATWPPTGPTSPGPTCWPSCPCSQSPVHAHLFVVCKFLYFKECDRNPSTGAGFPPLRPDRTCESQSSDPITITAVQESVAIGSKSTFARLCHLTGRQVVRSSQQTSLTRCSCQKCLEIKGNQD